MTFELPPTEIIARAKSPRPRGYMLDWKPRADTERLLADIADVLSELASVLPVTGRQIFYRLVAKGRIGKTERDASRLNEVLQKARRAGLISWDDIRDDGITRLEPFAFDSEDGARRYMQSAADQLRINPMALQPIRQFIICEAAGMVPQLARVADPYGIPVISSGGFNSVTAKRALALEMSAKPSLVLHIGDHDPSGVHCFQSLAEDVEAFADKYDGEVSFQRLAVTPQQINAMALPTAPAKKLDKRAFDGGTVQAEAIDPRTLAGILESKILEFIDTDLLAEAEARSAALREEFAP